MIPFRHTSYQPIRNLPKLLRAYNSRGGSIVEFQRVVSCIFLSHKSSHYVWVPPNGSCALRSLPDTLTTLLLGWWSLFGFFWTIQVLVTNLGGGRDATQELLDATGGGNAKLAEQALDEEYRVRRQQSIRAILLFIGILGGIALFFWVVGKISDWSMKRSNARHAISTQQVHARERPRTVANASLANRAITNTAPTAPISAARKAHLQAIFYDKNGRSTAIVDGKTVSAGESVSGDTVLIIGPQSVTVKSASGEEKVLYLPNNGQ